MYEKYAEQERALRIQAVKTLRRHEEKMLGKLTEVKEVKDDQSSENEGPTPKRPRVNMMRAGGTPPEEDVDQRLNDIIEKRDAITLEFNVTQEENRTQQRRLNAKHKELMTQF